MKCRQSQGLLLRKAAVMVSTLLNISFQYVLSCRASSDFDEAAKLFGNAKFEDALHLFDKEVDSEPTNGTYHYWRGRCLAELGRPKEAAGEYKVAMLLSNDAKVKSDCKSELEKLNVPVPDTKLPSDGTMNQIANASSIETRPESSKELSGAPKERISKSSLEASIRQSKSIKAERQISDVDGVPILKAGDKTFKLSSKKLEWDLKISGELKNKLASGNQNLDSLARNTRWTLPHLATASPLYGNRRNPMDLAAEISRGPAHFTGSFTESERNTLIASDIIFVLDHSGSMSHGDCPAGSPNSYAAGVQSRISWCAEEIEAFSDRILSALPHGFTLITFDSKPDVYPIRTAYQLRDAVNKLEGSGGTDLAAALNEAFRIHSGHPKQPLLIVLITDAEVDIRSSEQTILEGCRRFPNAMFITMMQIGIGAEAHTADTLALFDDLPKKAGAAYDPVEAIPFSRVRREGFGRSMLSGLQRNYYANRAAIPEEKAEKKER